MRHRQSRGFTFKEALVAYALMAMVAVVIYSLYALCVNARECARTGVCQSNLRELSLAILLYTQDHDDHLPLAVTSTGVGWVRRCFPNFPECDDVFDCPGDRGLKHPVNIDDPNGFSYIANGEVLRSARAKAYSTAAIKNPAHTVLLAERKHDVPVRWSFTARTFPVAVDPRHNSGAHWSFVDGHVKWIMPQKFTEGETDYTIVPALKEADEKDVTTGNDEGDGRGSGDAR
jgi:prepilin-type processing-associated H-X9-DG protein